MLSNTFRLTFSLRSRRRRLMYGNLLKQPSYMKINQFKSPFVSLRVNIKPPFVCQIVHKTENLNKKSFNHRLCVYKHFYPIPMVARLLFIFSKRDVVICFCDKKKLRKQISQAVALGLMQKKNIIEDADKLLLLSVIVFP